MCVIRVTFNGVDERIASLEDFSLALERFDRQRQFELWLAVPDDGPLMGMVRNGADAFLVHLVRPGEVGVVSRGARVDGEHDFVLANGQVDAQPLAWCVGVESCYRALAYFFVNAGERTPHVTWSE